jgi:hypothetical protein
MFVERFAIGTFWTKGLGTIGFWITTSNDCEVLWTKIWETTWKEPLIGVGKVVIANT